MVLITIVNGLINQLMSMDVYGTYNYTYWGESKPTNITGGHHPVAAASER